MKNHVRCQLMGWLCCLMAAVFLSGMGLLNVSAEPISQRILGGEDAEEGEWPFMVGLVNPEAEHPTDLIICGAVLVDARYVLTAAHCVMEWTGAPAALESRDVLVGRTTITSPIGRIVAVEEIILHPEYNDEFTLRDAALLRLAEPVYLPTVRVADPEIEQSLLAGGSGTILGWGYQHAQFPILPDTLQEAEIPIVSTSECSDRLGLDFVPEVMLCGGKLASAPNANDGVDTCLGDSGGPLVVEHLGEHYTVGVTSWGFDCGTDVTYGAYTRVSAVSDWIQGTLDPVTRIARVLKDIPNLLHAFVNPEPGEVAESANGQFTGPGALKPSQLAGLRATLRVRALRILFVEETLAVASYPGLKKRLIERLDKLTLRLVSGKKRKKKAKKKLKRKIDRIVRRLSAGVG